MDQARRDIIIQLARPIRPEVYEIPNYKRRKLSTRRFERTLTASRQRSTHRLALILALPPEVFLMIFKHLPPSDAINLGTCNFQFWQAFKTHLMDKGMASFGAWAGQKIIISPEARRNPTGPSVSAALAAVLGTHPTHIPTSHVVASLVARLSAARARRLGTQPSPSSITDPKDPPTLETYTAPMSENALLLSSLESFREINLRINDKTKYISPAIKARLEDIGSMKLTFFLPARKAWVLRSLTAKKFVRGSALADSANRKNGPFLAGKGTGFADVVMYRTVTDNDELEPKGYWVNRGAWAGHALDIVTLEYHAASTAKEAGEWTDISREVKWEMMDLKMVQVQHTWQRVLAPAGFEYWWDP